jgi:hypothetical protein
MGVADRLFQMCYWKEFNLKNGSFRQVDETERIQQEIRTLEKIGSPGKKPSK